MIYMDNAATSFPKPDAVIEKMTEVMKNYAANPGRSGHKAALRMDREIYEARETLARFIGAKDAMNVSFTLNATQSLNTVIHGCAEKGMHVITTSMEHNSVYRPLMALCEQGWIECSIVDGDKAGRVSLERIQEAIKPNTGMLVINHMSNVTGTIQDIQQIGAYAQSKKIRVILDASQSMGNFKIDVSTMPIDALCFPGHKGLFGPMGTGAFFLRDGVACRPLMQGGTGSFSSELVQPDILPDRFESGTQNGPGIIALAEGIRFIESVGLKNIHQKESALRHHFYSELEKMENIRFYGPGKEEESGPILAMNVRGMDSAEVAAILDQDFDICIRPGLHCAPLAHVTLGTTDQGICRWSFSYFNTLSQVEEAVKAMQELVRSKEWKD